MLGQIFITVIALVLVFIFAINKFSRQIETVAGGQFKNLIGRLTKNRIIGAFTGTAITSVLQSSTATTVMTVGLVNAGIITFGQSLGIIFGANIGTTITSQLIALNVTAVAPFIIIIGFFILKFGGRYLKYGKPIFYFGLVFFCISLITQVVAPLSDNSSILYAISKINSLPLAILTGIIITTLFQASIITNGLILALGATGLIDFQLGVGLMLGANIGTTSTAILVTLPMAIEAKKAALAHFLFNVMGVIIIYPFIRPFMDFVGNFGGSTIQQIANMHLAFNIFAAIVFLIFIKKFTKLIEWISTRKVLHMDTKVFDGNVDLTKS